MSENIISLYNVNKTFTVANTDGNVVSRLYKGMFGKKTEIKALQDVNFHVKKGEIFGIIGRNGSGKSTLLKLIIGCIKPDAGSVIDVEGNMMRLTLGMGFNPDLTARDNIYLNGAILGLTFKKIGQIFDEVINFAELKEFIDVPVKHFSKGMLSRLKFSIALHAETDILLIDEFFGGVGDIAFRRKSTELFKSNLIEGRTIVMVSHSMKTIFRNCDRVLLLNKGKVLDIDNPNKIIRKYQSLFSDEDQTGNVGSHRVFKDAPGLGGAIAANFDLDIDATTQLIEIRNKYSKMLNEKRDKEGKIKPDIQKKINHKKRQEVKKIIGSGSLKKFREFEKWWRQNG